VGILIDASIIIAAERGGLRPNVEFDEEVGISSITASSYCSAPAEAQPRIEHGARPTSRKCSSGCLSWRLAWLRRVSMPP
jgi:hypothetical protein